MAAVTGEYARIARKIGVRELETVVTAPGRQGDEPQRLLDTIGRATAADVRVVSAEDEGRLAFTGAVSRANPGDGVVAVCDVGGGSTEVVVGSELLGPAWVRSVDLGSLRLTAAQLAGDPPAAAEIEAARSTVHAAFEPVQPPRPEIALATGGSARAVARVIGHEYGPDDLERLIELLAARPASVNAEKLGLRPDRASTPCSQALSSWPRSHACSSCRSRRRVAASARASRSGWPLGSSPPRSSSSSTTSRGYEEQGSRRRPSNSATLSTSSVGREVPLTRRISHHDALRPPFGVSIARGRQLRADSSARPSPPRPRAARKPRRSAVSHFPFGNDQSSYFGRIARPGPAVAGDHTAGGTNLIYASFASRFHADPAPARRADRALQFPLDEAPGGNRAGGVPPASARRRSAATTASWCAPEHVLERLGGFT